MLEEENCPICIKVLDFVNTITTECGHKYHVSCLESNRVFSSDCPLCRKSLYKCDFCDNYKLNSGKKFLFNGDYFCIDCELYYLRKAFEQTNEKYILTLKKQIEYEKVLDSMFKGLLSTSDPIILNRRMATNFQKYINLTKVKKFNVKFLSF